MPNMLSMTRKTGLQESIRAAQWRTIETIRTLYYARTQRLVSGQLRRDTRAVIRMMGEVGSLDLILAQLDSTIAAGRSKWEALLQRTYRGVSRAFAPMPAVQLQAKRSLPGQDGFYFLGGTFETRAEEGNALRGWIMSESAQKVKWISETTIRLLQGALTEGVDEGESIPQLQTRIRDLGRDFSLARSLRIARTEVMNASNAVQVMQVQDDAELDENVIEKEWLSARDKNVRDAHRKLDGQRVLNTEAFQVEGSQLRWPGDGGLGAPPSLTVNERCTLLFLEK